MLMYCTCKFKAEYIIKVLYITCIYRKGNIIMMEDWGAGEGKSRH